MLFICLYHNITVHLKKHERMRKLFTLIASVLFLGSFNSNAQIFWSENFESGSTGGMVAGSYGS